MKKKSIINFTIVLVSLVLAAVVYYFKYLHTESDSYYSPRSLSPISIESYAGSETCIECHADLYKTHIKTPHYNTSSLADSISIHGSFEKGYNILDLDDVTFEMSKENGSFYQHTTIKNRDIQIAPSKFDIVIGSGLRGQSYLSWKEDELFQLQSSYYSTSDNWINSPGYPSYFLERPIRNECLKCHVTIAENKDVSGMGNHFFKERIIYGVDCEKCHGPSAEHVDYHIKNKVDAPKFILQLDSLSRQQRLDICAQCHSGLRTSINQEKSISFLPGENLDDYSHSTTEESNKKIDVHGNQYGLLTQSECFKQTTNMDCTTCHNPHENQRGNTNYFNQKCVGCHTNDTKVCTVQHNEMSTSANNCISCHMPMTPSKSMTAQLVKDSLETSFYIRTHLIDIYPKQ